MKNENISIKDREKIINKLSFLIYDMGSIPSELFKKIIKDKKMVIDWYNISKCAGIASEMNIKDDLIDCINNTNTIEQLERQDSINDDHPISKEEIEKICRTIVSNVVKIDTFNRLFKNTKKVYEIYSENKFEEFIQDNIGKIDKDKIKILIEESVLKLNVENYEYMKENYSDEYIHIQLVKKHINEYIESYNDYNLEYTDLIKLLSSNIENEDKSLIINNIYKQIVTTTEDIDDRLNNIVSEYLYESNEKIDFIVLKHIINRDISDDKKALIISNQVKFLDGDYIIDLLKRIGNGYEYILETGKLPRIKNNKVNKKLCEELKKHDYISSWNEKDKLININRKRKLNA